VTQVRAAGGGGGVHLADGHRHFREPGRVGGLNLYSIRPSAFDDHIRQAATLLAILTSVVMGQVIALDQLHSPLQTRQLGRAVGIVCTGTRWL
jgi:hypothetical protein